MKPARLALPLIVLWCIVVATAGAVTQSCKTWSPTEVAGRAVDCAEKTLVEKGISYAGRVNDILASSSLSDATAQGKLADLGLEAGEDVIGCLLFREQSQFADSATKNPNDAASALASKRAQGRLGYLETKGWQFR